MASGTPGSWEFAENAGMALGEHGSGARSGPLGVAPHDPRAAAAAGTLRSKFQGSRVRFKQFDLTVPSDVTALESVATNCIRRDGWHQTDKRYSHSVTGSTLVTLNWIEPDPSAAARIAAEAARNAPEAHMDAGGNKYLIQPTYGPGVPDDEVAPGNTGALDPADLFKMPPRPLSAAPEPTGAKEEDTEE